MPLITDVPLFPLGVVLYPHERLPLHVFESRYRDLVRHCRETDERFGIVLEQEGRLAEVGSFAALQRIVNTYEDGRLDIIVEGQERFRLIETRQVRTYMTADVEPLTEPRESPRNELKERAITQHMKLLELAGRTVRPSLYQNVREVSFVMAHNAGLTLEQKQEVLEMRGENDRIAFLVSHFESLIPQVEEMEDVRRKIQSNGHFKDFPAE